MPGKSSILEKAEAFISMLLRNNLPGELSFHNADHTREVVSAAILIGNMSGLSNEGLVIVQLAAWFHDAGYCCTYHDHEASSIHIAIDFLHRERYPDSPAGQIISCINATRFPQNPKNLLEEVICDADLYHLSQSDYQIHEQSLRKEWERWQNRVYSDQEWNLMNCDMLTSHYYFTSYGKSVLQPLKEKNIDLLKCRY